MKGVSLVGNKVKLVLLESNGETHTFIVPAKKVKVYGGGLLFVPINDSGESKTAIVDRSGVVILPNAK